MEDREEAPTLLDMNASWNVAVMCSLSAGHRATVTGGGGFSEARASTELID